MTSIALFCLHVIFASLLFSIFVLSLFVSLFGLIEIVKRVKKIEKSPWTAGKKTKQGPKKKTKAEFAESKKKNLADIDSDKESFEQIELSVATSFSVLFPCILFLVFPFLSHAQVQQREHT